MNRLLLLEDDISLVDGLVYMLEREGYRTDVARTVREAQTALLEKNIAYDLLLLDVTLPDGTGYEVCEQVRAAGNQAPILFLTASDEELNIIRGLDSGGDDYLTKPFRMGELCSNSPALSALFPFLIAIMQVEELSKTRCSAFVHACPAVRILARFAQEFGGPWKCRNRLFCFFLARNCKEVSLRKNRST